MLVSTGVLVAFPLGKGRAGHGDLTERPRERIQPATASHNATVADYFVPGGEAGCHLSAGGIGGGLGGGDGSGGICH
jgi:hypothetical protein